MDFYFYLSKILGLFLSPVNFLFLFLLINLSIYYFFKKKIFKFFSIISLIFITIFAFFTIGNILINYLEKNYTKQEEIYNIDAIVVLSGSENIINTTKFKKLDLFGSSERLIAFVELANKYKDSKLIYLGGNSYLNNKNILSETEVAKIFFKNINFDINKVIFLNSSRNTLENFQTLSNYNKDKNFKNILLISSAFHMKRSLMIAEKFKLNLIPYAVDFRSFNSNDFKNRWQKFSVSKNFSNLDLAFNELIGYFVAKLVL